MTAQPSADAAPGRTRAPGGMRGVPSLRGIGRGLAGFARPLRSRAPERPPVRHILAATSLLAAGLALIGLLADTSADHLLIPSLGASMALIVGAPELPLSQPRNVVLGHLIGFGVGWALSLAWPGSLTAGGVAAALTFGLMLALRCAHSPATATALSLVWLPTAAPLHDLLMVGAGAVLVVACGWAAVRSRRLEYPVYWW